MLAPSRAQTTRSAGAVGRRWCECLHSGTDASRGFGLLLPMPTELDSPAIRRWRSPRRYVRVALAVLLAWLLLAALLLSVSARAASAQTVVSLTFDDGTATQYQADQMLADHGMHGTFYLNSS